MLVARNPQEAANVQQLAVALGAAETAAPAGGAGPEQPGPAPTAATGGGTETAPLRLRTICTAGIFLLVALGALAALVYLYRRWRAARDVDHAGTAYQGYAPLPGESPAAEAAEQEKARPLGGQAYPWEETPTAAAAAASRPDLTLDSDSPPERDVLVDDNGTGPQAATARPTAAPKPIGPGPGVPARGEVEPPRRSPARRR